jgi:hypothetical protein
MHNWYEDTETPMPREHGMTGRCLHNGLFADGGPLTRTHYCGDCGQMVPNADL